MSSRYLVARLRFSNSVKFCSSRALCKNLIRLTLNSWDNWCRKAFQTETQRCRANSNRKIIIKIDKKLDKIELQNVKSDLVQFKLMLKSSIRNKVSDHSDQNRGFLVEIYESISCTYFRRFYHFFKFRKEFLKNIVEILRFWWIGCSK